MWLFHTNSSLYTREKERSINNAKENREREFCGEKKSEVSYVL
jgi:hypothetical protein